MVDIKFCGLTRPEDAATAAKCGATFAGVIFAGGPRMLDPILANEVLDSAGPGLKRVGVFASAPVAEIVGVARQARLEIIQLHADPVPAEIRAVRADSGCRIWATVRVSGSELPAGLRDLAAEADALVLDARVTGRLGGTGVSLDWDSMATALADLKLEARIVLAGGLTPANVARAIEVLGPDVVDVSSGVERSPGIKDHDRMRGFAAAVRGARRRQ